MTPTLDAILGIVALVLAAAAIAGVLRGAHVVGAALLGGVIAGVLLGPTLLGRVLPTVHERAFVGAVQERRALIVLQLEAQAWERSVIEADATRVDAQQTRVDQDQRRAAIDEAQSRMERGTFDHRRWPRGVAVLLGAFVIVSASWPRAFRRRTGGSTGDRSRLQLPDGAWRNGMWKDGGWAVGAFAAVVAAAGGIAVAALAGHDPIGPAALACGAALAVGPWRLSWRDLRIARGAERTGPQTILAATSTASLIAAALLVASALSSSRGTDGAASGAALVAAAVIAVGTLLAILIGARPTPPWFRRFGSAFASTVAIPSIAALATVRIELLLDASLWPLLLLPLIAGDGRWLGGMIGAMLLGGRGPGRASRLLLTLASAGPTQMSVAAIGLWTELLPATLALGLVFGSLILELTGPMRRRADRTIRDVETMPDHDSP